MARKFADSQMSTQNLKRDSFILAVLLPTPPGQTYVRRHRKHLYLLKRQHLWMKKGETPSHTCLSYGL